MTSSVSRAALAAALLSAPVTAQAASDLAWTGRIAALPESRRPAIGLAELADGTLLAGTSPGVAHLSRDGRTLGFRSDLQPIDDTKGAITSVEYSSFNLSQWSEGACRGQANLFAGQPLREFNTFIGFDPAKGYQFDGEGGLIEYFGGGYNYLARVLPDCTFVPLRNMLYTQRPPFLADPRRAVAYTVMYGDGPVPSRLHKLDRTGTAWSRDIAAEMKQVTRQGGVILVSGDNPRSTIENINPDGTLAWSRTWDSAPHTIFADDEYIYAIGGAERGGAAVPQRVYALDAQGLVAWSDVAGQELVPVPEAFPSPRLLFKRRLDYNGPHELVQAGANGLELVMRDPPDAPVVQRLRDGGLVASKRPGFQSVELSTDGREVRAFDASVRLSPDLRGLLHDAGGVVVATSHGDVVELHRWSARGDALATTVLPTLPPLPATQQRSLTLVGDATRACVVDVAPSNSGSYDAKLSTVCVDRRTGAVLHAWNAGATSVGRVRIIGMENDGLVLQSSESAAGAVSIVTRVIAADGSQRTLQSVRSSVMPAGVFGAAGHYASLSSAIVTAYNPDLSVRWQLPVNRNYAQVLAVGSDGSVLATEVYDLMLVSDTGVVKWRRPMPLVPSTTTTGVFLPDGSIIATTPLESQVDMAYRRTQRVRADGSVMWQFDARDDNGRYQWELSADGKRVHRWSAGNGARSSVLDADTGQLLYSAGAPASRGVALRSLRRDDGSLATAHQDGASGEIRVTVTKGADWHASAGRTIDSSLLGAWSLPQVSGQGLFFDVDASGLAFGAWFTHGPRPREERANLHWYTLTPIGNRGASRTFAIYENIAGRFAEGPASTARVAGEATLTLIDCDTAKFDYVVLKNARESRGSSVLVRTLPGARACAGGDGLDAVASNGFDPKSSGAWHDPANPGQGIAFDLRPPIGAQPGFFAGAWFTFDPAGRADDAPDNQHWFTLAGPVSADANGIVEVPIQRTIGGSLGGRSTQNTWRVGTAKIEFTSCHRATLSWQFDRNDIAGAYSGLSGTRTIVRVGGCGD